MTFLIEESLDNEISHSSITSYKALNSSGTVFVIMQMRKAGTFLQHTHTGNITVNILDIKTTLFLQLFAIVLLYIKAKRYNTRRNIQCSA